MPPKKKPGLTPKQQAFIAHYLACNNAGEAAELAGYRGDPATEGARLLRNPEIKRRVETPQLNVSAKDITCGSGDVIKGLLDEARGLGPDTTSSARIAAWSQLGKLLGIERPKQVDVRMSGGLAAYRELGPEELHRRYLEALGEAGAS